MKTMLAIIRADFYQRRWLMLWWVLGVGAMVGIDTMLYATVKNEAAQLGQLFDSMPKAVSALFADGSNLLSQPGFLSGRVYYLLLPLLLIIFAIKLGGGIVAKEEENGTLELLLARPIGRTRLLLAKFAVYLLAMFLLGVTTILFGLIALRPAGLDQIPFMGVVWASISTLLLSTIFGALAFAMSAWGHRWQSAAAGVAALVAFISYLSASLETLASWLVWPARLLPYHYFHPTAILADGSGGFKPMLGYAVVILILGILSVIGFRRRDIG